MNKWDGIARIVPATVCTVAFFVGANPLPVMAKADESAEEVNVTFEVEDSYESPESEETNETVDPEDAAEEEHYGPLTPDGNLTLVDDYGDPVKSGKQFITVVSKSGNYFYIIIDRDDRGDETVHFLNLVDEADLLALMEDEEVEAYQEALEAEQDLIETQTDEEQESEEEGPTLPDIPSKLSGKSRNITGVIVMALFAVIGGVAGFTYLKSNHKKKEKPLVDPDADYDEREDNYLDQLPEEIEEETMDASLNGEED